LPGKSFVVRHENRFWTNQAMTAAAVADNRTKSFNKARSQAPFACGAIGKSGVFLCYFIFRQKKRK
jgi:hypothetical protein